MIESPPEKRILVDAGPGTGKTALACGRVAWLIKNGIFGDKILLISFTRTAVQEIRDRIRFFLNNEEEAYAVMVATLDSHAWKIHSGFDGGAELIGTYNENIEKLIKLIREDRDGAISEYLDTFKHLIVDEAQDIVGIRAELLMEIIGKLSDNCGITVFSDDAQAIYGFSLDEDDFIKEKNQKTLSENIREKFRRRFSTCELKKVYRTNSHTLNELFTTTRQKVLKPAENPLKKHNEVRNDILGLADETNIPRVETGGGIYPDECFFLYRRRAEVLMAASLFGITPHRIRMSGLPHCLHPWVGTCLSEHTKKTLTEKDFMNYWANGVEGTTKEIGADQKGAWGHLVRLAGKTHTVVDMNILRQRLGQGKPPSELCFPEIGTKGPIIGTIHASKGREADIVYLRMPEEINNGDINENTDYDEETRVLYVGATRARKFLGVGDGYNYHFSSKVENSGRVFKNTRNMTAMVEIGREDDISARGIAGRNYYEDADAVRKNQKRLHSLANRITIASATIDRHSGFVYRLTPENENEDIAVLSKEALTSDLFEIGKIIGGNNRRPPDGLKYLRIYGLRTIVLPPGSPECNDLYEPWASSGIILAPVILGYTKEFFP